MQPGTPGAQPGQQPQQAPFGTSSMTGPTPNKGYEANAIQRVSLLVKQMAEILPQIGATSDLGQALMKAMQGLSKHVTPGTSSNAAEKNAIEKMAITNQQNGQMQQQLKQAMGPQGAAPPPPMPKAA